MRPYRSDEERQSGARRSYAQRMQEEERRRQAQQRAEEAARRAEERRREAQQRAEAHRRQMQEQKQQREADSASLRAATPTGGLAGSKSLTDTWQPKPPQTAAPAQTGGPGSRTSISENSFYTNAKPSGIIPPKLESIEDYNKEIDNQQKALDALYKQQYTFMLNNDEAGMSALDTSIKKTEQDIGALKTQLGQVMGADIRGQRGNQLTQGDVSPLVYKMPDGEQKPYDFGMTPFENKSGAVYDDLVKPLSASIPKADKGLEDEEKAAVKPYKEDPFQGRHTNDDKAYAGGAFGGGGTGGSWGSESDSLLTNWRSSLV